MKKFLNSSLLLLICAIIGGCAANDIKRDMPENETNSSKTIESKAERIEKPKPSVRKIIKKEDYYKKIFNLQSGSAQYQSLIFSLYEGDTRVVIYSHNGTDNAEQNCKFDEIVFFKNGKFHYENNGGKITFELNPDGKNLNVLSSGKRIEFCKNGSIYGNYLADLNFKNVITKYSFGNFTRDMKASEILKKFSDKSIKKGVGYADEKGDKTTEYYVLDDGLEPLFCIISSKDDEILELHILSPIYKTPQGLSVGSKLKDIFNKIEVSKIGYKEDKILIQTDEIEAKFEFDASSFMIKKPYSFDALSPYSPVSKIILNRAK